MFKLLHKENRPGERLLDQYTLYRIKLNTKALPNKAEQFAEWFMDEFMSPLQTCLRSPSDIVIFMDESVKKGDKLSDFKAGATYIMTRADDTYVRCTIEMRTISGSTLTSFDTECLAMAIGIEGAMCYIKSLPDNGDLIENIHIYVNNKSAADQILEPGIHHSQEESL